MTNTRSRSSMSARQIAPPSGFLRDGSAIVYTDIVGSTAMAEKMGDKWIETLTRHHDAVRSVFEVHGAFEATNQGDGFLFLFQDLAEAATAVVEAMEKLSTLPRTPDDLAVRIRAGIHWGTVGFSPGVGFFGVSLHRGSRVAGAATGGQILLSEPAADLLAPALRDGWSLFNHGHFRLKNLRRPEPLIELCVAGSPPMPPIALPITERGLPHYSSEFFGREAVLEDVSRLVDQPHGEIITVCGPGGVGKTRLAVELLRARVDHPGFFVDLSQAVSSNHLLPGIARSLGLDPNEALTLEQVADQLNQYGALLVLDNLEQIIDCAPDVGELARLAPEASIVVTSRLALRVATEVVVELAPFPTGPATRAELPGTELFLQLAGIDDPQPAQRDTASHICRVLDGLPLAIELAAGRVQLLGLEAVAEQLSHSVGLLRGGRRDAPERHRAIDATVMWSYRLVSVHAQALFRALSQFPAGATLADLQALERFNDSTLLEALAELVEHRLAMRVDAASGPRYSMLRVIREVAAAELDHEHEVASTRRQISRHLCARAATSVLQLGAIGEGQTYARLLDDLDNYRAFLGWAAEGGEMLDIGLATAADLMTFWWHDHLAEGVDSLRRLTSLPGAESSPNLAKALVSMSVLSTYGGLPGEAMQWAQRAVAIARSLGRSGRTLCTALQQLAIAHSAHGASDLALAAAYEGMSIAAGLSEFGRAMQLVGLGPVLLSENQVDRAEVGFRDAIEIFDQHGPSWLAAAPVARLGECALRRGDLTAAGELAVAGVERWNQSPGVNGKARAWSGLARVRWCEGNIAEARAIAKDAVASAFEHRAFGDIPWALIVAGATAITDGRPAEARQLFDASTSMARAYSQPLLGALRHELAAPYAEAYASLDTDHRTKPWESASLVGVLELVESL